MFRNSTLTRFAKDLMNEFSPEQKNSKKIPFVSVNLQQF
jgi:hypothetical protein